jgi:transposase InsO family protein
MAESVVTLDVRLIIATWPVDGPRGAVSRFCRENGVSRSQFYEIRGRARREGLEAALAVRSRRPRTSPSMVPAGVEDLAVWFRKRLGEDGWDCGPRSVRAELVRHGVVAPSVATLARIFTRRGLVVPAPAKRPRSSWRRFAFAAPNECWQLDATEWTLADGRTAVVFQVLDDHSRRLLASLAAEGETAAAACQVVAVALGRCGIPQLFLTDNGLALNPSRRGMTGQLERHLRTLGVRPITSRPYHPQTCGKNERVHATLKRWLRAQPRAATLAGLQAQIDLFDEHYNTHRPHQALGGQTPEQAWNATPAAPAPPAPTPPTEPPPRDPAQPTVTHPKVAANGNVLVARRTIQTGWEHRGTRLIAVTTGDHIDLFDPHGTHIRSIDLEPGRTHYPSGRPRGGTLRQKQAAGQPGKPTQPSGIS